MINHYITKYTDLSDHTTKAVAWIQINLFGKCWCVWKKEIEI